MLPIAESPDRAVKALEKVCRRLRVRFTTVTACPRLPPRAPQMAPRHPPI